MTNANYQFSLVKDPWLPVLFNNGTQDRLTLLEVFDCAEEIRSVAAPNPLDRFALLRFLAIVAAWSCPSQTLPRWQEICSGVPSFLEQHMQCFNLFGDGPRFYQDAAAKNKNDTVGKLFHEIPTGTNIAHFMHVTDEGGYGICPGCCTVALLRLPVFSTVGGKGYSPSPRPTGTYAFAHTECLAEAISWGASRILQIASTTNTPLGDPVWSSNPQPSGFLEKLTMSPRWVWLHDPSSNIKPCLMCGNSSQLITTVGYAPAPSKNKMDDPFWLTDDIRPPFISDDFERASRLHELRGRVSEFLGNYQTSQSTPPTTPQASLWCVTFHADQAKGLTLFECRISTAAAAVSNDYSLFLAPTIGGKQTKKKFDTYFRVWRDPKKVTLSIKSTKRYSPLPAVYVTTTKIPLPQTPEALKRWQTTQNKLALRTFAYHSVVPTAFSRHLAYKIFATVPDLPEKRTSSPPSQVRDYIRRLAGDSGLKAGNLAVLRALSGQDLAHSVEAFDLFSGLYWPIRQQSPRAPQREDAWLVTKVYSKFPWVPSDNESTYISRYAAQLWRQVHGEAHFLPSLVRRFDRLMAAKGAEFEFSLLWLFAAVRRSLNLSSTSHPLLPGRWPSHAWSLLLEELRYLDSLKNNFVKKILMYPII